MLKTIDANYSRAYPISKIDAWIWNFATSSDKGMSINMKTLPMNKLIKMLSYNALVGFFKEKSPSNNLPIFLKIYLISYQRLKPNNRKRERTKQPNNQTREIFPLIINRKLVILVFQTNTVQGIVFFNS